MKIASIKDAVKLVDDNAIVGLGGFSTARRAMAVVHELIRARKKNLTICGTNLSIDMDMLVAAGCVKKVECGTGNLERYGIAYNFRKRIENGSVQIEDHSHLGMCLRLTAAEFGIPFIPIKSWLGTDILKYSECAKVIENPFKIDEKIVVLKKLQPDIAFIHLQKADKNGNAEIDGCLFHDVELARASKKVVVIAEELVDEDYFRLNPRFTTIPFVYTIKVVHQPFGAHPTAVYGYYREDENHLRKWQMVSRKGGVDLKKYLEEYVYSVDNFDEYLLKISDIENLKADTQLGY